MRVNRPLLILLACIITCTSNAGELTLEPHAMLYFRMSLDGGSRKQAHSTFGLRIDRALVERGRPIDYRQLFRQPAIMDFSLNGTGIEALTIAGVDYLEKYRALHAAEEDEAAAAEEAAAAPAEEDGGEAVPAAAEGSEEAPAEAAAGDETATADESVAAEDEEQRKLLPSYSDLFKENQRFGLIIGGVLLAGFVIGVGN
jgi:hypothetical protein